MFLYATKPQALNTCNIQKRILVYHLTHIQKRGIHQAQYTRGLSFRTLDLHFILPVCLFFDLKRGKMETEVKNFIDNVDSWIKQIRREFAEFQDVPHVVNESVDNIQHNYELIYELKDQIEELKQEINALKLIQIISLKKGMQEKKEAKIS